jgi:methionine-rich copper-binding protein CopC
MSLTHPGTDQNREDVPGERRRGSSALIGACTSIVLGFASLQACAHAIVERSSPAAHAVVAPGQVMVTIDFNTRLDHARSRLSLEAPGGAVSRVALEANTPATAIGGRCELNSEGLWKLKWQVLAADGHITRGEIPFVVRFAKETR